MKDVIAATDEAIRRAETHANEYWKAEAYATVRIFCLRGKPFTSEDVSKTLSAKGIKTHENRALGAVMREACKEGLIRGVGFSNSTRPESHTYPKRIWMPVKGSDGR